MLLFRYRVICDLDVSAGYTMHMGRYRFWIQLFSILTRRVLRRSWPWLLFLGFLKGEWKWKTPGTETSERVSSVWTEGEGGGSSDVASRRCVRVDAPNRKRPTFRRCWRHLLRVFPTKFSPRGFPSASHELSKRLSADY